jgi:SAM-dependent methyltransferase
VFKVRYSDHNWLIKKINNNNVVRHRHLYKGWLYDLGCGTRPYEDFIGPLTEAYIGVDWQNTLHDQKMDVVADLNQPLPIEDAQADTVVCFQTLEHLCEPQAFLKEARRIMKPGAHILITVPFMWHVHEPPYDFFRYTRYGLEHLLKKAGFEDIQIKADSGFWTMLALKINYQTYRYGGRLGKWVHWLLAPFWFLNQVLLPLLDVPDRNERETVSYCVQARRPL